jgi:hypothetical protein
LQSGHPPEVQNEEGNQMAQHGYLTEYDEGRDRREGRERDRDDPNRGFMLEDRERNWDRDRGFFGSMSNQARERGAFGGYGEWERAPRNFGSSQDDHFRSWRAKQVEALDRDYADYCREREEQFHHDFDTWRSQRHGNPQPLQAGMAQTPSTLELTDENAIEAQSGPDPMATATLGTTSSGRSRR